MNMYMLCLRSYLEPDDDHKSDFMISTIKTPLEILGQYPKIRMIICEYDPIHDDNLRFVHRFR